MAPGSLMDEDDDEEDIGMADIKDSPSNGASSNAGLNFDDETTKEGSQTADLISLDDNSSGGAKQRKNVPKLKGPKK